MEQFDYSYNEEEIQFELHEANVMVNATQMAKVFGKKVNHFTENEGTKAFISECLKSRNSGFLGIENEEDLITSKQKSGTWMHRVLALKFAAWLNPKFELWVYCTIDHILFGHYQRLEASLKESAQRKNRIDELKNKLGANPEFLELESLMLQERQASYRRTKSNSKQMNMFREMYQNGNSSNS